MTAQRQALLGLFFVLVFGILAWFTLFESELSLFRERVSLRVHFEQAGGLRQGDPVLVAGLRWGQVERLDYDPAEPLARRIEVVLSLDRDVRLFTDHAIQIEDSTVLGGKQLVIEPGLASSGEVDKRDLHGQVAPNVMKALGDVLNENRDSLSSILSGLEVMVGDVREGDGLLTQLLYNEQLAENLTKAVESVSATFENAQALTDEMRAGEGTLGKLFNDTELYDQVKGIVDGIDTFVTSAQTVVDDVRAGKGTVGMLLHDEEVSADVKAAVDRLAQVATDLDEGRGTLGKLLKDPTIADNIELITTELAEGRGTLGRLLREEVLYDDLRVVTEDLKTASAALRDGQGTFGRLLYEDELYVELERALRTLTGSLEETREAAPIATFLSTVFLGF